jgi:hypothetical protein
MHKGKQPREVCNVSRELDLIFSRECFAYVKGICVCIYIIFMMHVHHIYLIYIISFFCRSKE